MVCGNLEFRLFVVEREYPSQSNMHAARNADFNKPSQFNKNKVLKATWANIAENHLMRQKLKRSQQVFLWCAFVRNNGAAFQQTGYLVLAFWVQLSISDNPQHSIFRLHSQHSLETVRNSIKYSSSANFMITHPGRKQRPAPDHLLVTIMPSPHKNGHHHATLHKSNLRGINPTWLSTRNHQSGFHPKYLRFF